MDLLTHQKFIDSKRALAGKSFSANKELLLGVGKYYQEVIPSQIDLTLTVEIETYLNEIYLQSQHEYITSELQEMIRKMIGVSGAMSFSIKSKIFDAVFFENVKKLGEIIINISNVL